MWGLVTWAVTFMQHIPGSWQPGWKRESLRCTGSFCAPSWTPSLWNEPELHAPPSASLPKARSDQLSAGEAQGREQIHSRQGMIFKNICSLQQIGRGFLAHIRPTIRKPNLLPLLFSHLYQPEKNKNTLFGEWEDGQREERRNNRSERIEIDIQANLLTQNCS